MLALTLLAAVGTFVTVFERRRWLERQEACPVLLELTDKTTIAGMLVAVHGDCYVLEHARLMLDTGAQAIAGEMIFPRDRVRWIVRHGVTLDDLHETRPVLEVA